MSKRDGGPAFPRTGYYPDDPEDRLEKDSRLFLETQPEEGMSLRAWLAGKALTGFVSNGSLGNLTRDHKTGGLGLSNEEAEEVVATGCCRLADAVLRELAKPTGNEKWTTEEILKAEG